MQLDTPGFAICMKKEGDTRTHATRRLHLNCRNRLTHACTPRTPSGSDRTAPGVHCRHIAYMIPQRLGTLYVEVFACVCSLFALHTATGGRRSSSLLPTTLNAHVPPNKHFFRFSWIIRQLHIQLVHLFKFPSKPYDLLLQIFSTASLRAHSL